MRHEKGAPLNRSSLCYVSFFRSHTFLPQQFLYFFPLPQGQGSLRPIFGVVRTTVVVFIAESVT